MFYFDEETNGKGFDSVASEDEEEKMFGRSESSSSLASEERNARSQFRGRDSEQLIFGDFDDDESEAEEELGELVPLGMRNGRSPRGQERQRHHSKQVFEDFYKMTGDHLGSGAYGSVATCVSKVTRKEYAVKIVDKGDESHTRRRILREVNTFRLCKNHPNIVQLIEWFEDDDSFLLVFEKMRGGPLLRHILNKGTFTEEEARCVTRDITTALKFLHDRGVAHRDIKPENILCTEEDRVSPVKLCDLDLASRPLKAGEAHRLNQVASEPDLASPVGSAEFMAPEVVDTFVGDRLKYDKRCDMWSLGIILYIMLCGYAPFQGECDDDDCGWMEGQPCDECQASLFAKIQHGSYDFPENEWGMISSEAKDLVKHLLVKDVKKRFTADEVLQHGWIKKSAPPTSLQTPGNLLRNDSARDVLQMSEHFNAMSRIASLTSEMDEFSLSSQENNSSPSSNASPTDPPPFISEPAGNIPLFMMPPTEFWDSMSGQMIVPPESIGSPCLSTFGRTPKIVVKPRVFESTLVFEKKPFTRKSIHGNFDMSAPASSVPDLESCQSAVAKQESNSDLHQMTRETEVNV